MASTIARREPAVPLADLSEAIDRNGAKESPEEPLASSVPSLGRDEADTTAQADQDTEIVYPSGSKFFLVCFSLSLAILLNGLDLNVVAVCIPAITDHFHTVADVGWYSAGYRLMTCAFTFFFGKLYKIFRIKTVFMVAVVIFLLGSVLCASATSSRMFVLGRCVCGFANAGIISGAFIILTYLLPPAKRPFWTAILAQVESLASIAGPILGGILVEKLSWRWCFWISLPIGGISLPTIAFALQLPNTDDEARASMTWREALMELDLLGNFAFVPAMTCLFIALSWAGITYAWSDPKVIGCLVAFVVLFIIFAIDQYVRQDRAILPPRILRRRMVIAAAMFSLCCNSTLEIIGYYMPTYFQEVRGYSPGRSGFMMLPLLAGCMLAVLVYGTAAAKIGYFPPFMIVGSVLMPVAAGLMTTWRLDTDLTRLVLYPIFMGFASCIAIMAPQSAVQNYLSPADVPYGISIILFTHNFGPALALSMSQTIFTNQLVADLKEIVPGLNATTIDNAGLTELTNVLKGDTLREALFGVDKALIQTWYLVIGFACLSMVGSLLMEWKPIKEKTN